jgi:curved DNA-binding protein CbpA
VSQRQFVDFYEVLRLSPRASLEMIERVYRILAKRHHPDNQATGDSARFEIVQEAYETLSNADRRAAYDVKYDEVQNIQWKIFDQQSAPDGREDDRRIIHAMLSILYIERRRDPERGGLGPIILERMLGVPESHLEFPIWYMKQHGWIEILPSGQMGITVEGIDKLANKDLALRDDRLLAESSVVDREPKNPGNDTPHLGPRAVLAG